MNYFNEKPLDEKDFPFFLAMELAEHFYNEKTYQHAMRVAGYVASNKVIPEYLRNDCVCLAIMHDLIEDTDFEARDLPDDYCNFRNALILLTKRKDAKYTDYCNQIASKKCTTSYGICAYFVKLADMKDHLMLKETLTDKLKEKYLTGLAELL